VIVLGLPRAAAAAPNDKEVETLIDSVLSTDYPGGKYDDALAQLELGKQACAQRASCSAKVRGKLYIAIGTVLAGGQKKAAEARAAFAAALKEDPSASLVPALVTPEIQKAFDDARGGSAPAEPAPEPPKPAPPVAPPPEAPPAPAARKPKKTYPGGLRPARGWRNAEAYFYWEEATRSEGAGDWLDCVDYAEASLAAEGRQATRLLAASCRERAGLWIEALADYQAVLETAGRLGLRDSERRARQGIAALEPKIPKIVLRRPPRGDNLVVKMNDVEVPAEKLGGEIRVDPGQRIVSARATIDGAPVEFEEVVTLAEGETTTVDVKLVPRGAKNQAAMRCLLTAQTSDDFAKCVHPEGGLAASLDTHLNFELSGYHDDDHVDVVSPALAVSIESPTGGWGVNASILVDVVTAASVDIVATASQRWREERYAPAIGGHKRFGDVDVNVKGSLSTEPDYLATNAGAGVSVDLRQKTITPSLDYQFSYDIAGRSGTPFSVFSHVITRHAFDLSTTFVLDKATILAASFTPVFEVGDTSKPYRHVPMFLASVAARVPVGLAIDAVNMNRLSIAPYEQLPTNRQRWAVAGLLAHRFSSSTLRLEERLYVDSWGLKATTTDAQFLVDVSDRVRLWPSARVHAQSAVDFWQLAYVAKPASSGPGFSLPALRTGDKELGPLVGVTGGAGARFALGEHKNWALQVTGDVNYTRFLDHLYLIDRIAFFGATTLEVDFE
jgi:hypothetical protein